jgi:predicted dehydrogenase
MTRPGSHFLISKYFLERNSNILVAKPCGVSKNQAEELLKISIKFKKKIFCDFTYHFSSVIKIIQLDSKLKKTIQELQEYVSYRTSLGIVQSDLDVIADLACHDFYILGLLTKSQPLSVQCLNIGGASNSLVKSVVINLRYKSGLSAVIHVGWNSPNKIRYSSFISDSSGIVIDENTISSPIKYIRYKKLSDNYLNLTYANRNQSNTRYSMGPSYSPIVSQKESLATEFEEIAQNLHGKNNKLPTVIDAINIWKVIDSCRKSLKSNEGKFVKI